MSKMNAVVKLLGLCGCALAVTVHAALVQNVEVRGNVRIPEKTIISSAGQKLIGANIVSSQFSKIIKALFATEWFSDVKVRLVKNTLVIEVKERPTIVVFEMGDVKLLPTEIESKIRQDLGIVIGKPYNPSAAKKFIAMIKQRYKEMGHDDVKVNLEQELLSDNRVKIVVKIEHEKAAYIDNLLIEGNSQASRSRILYELGLWKPKLLARLTGTGHYSELALQKVLDELTELYHSLGFLNMHVVNHSVEKNTSTGYVVSVKINEGPLFEVKKIEVDGLPEEAMKAMQNIEVEQKNIDAGVVRPFNREWLNGLRESLQQRVEKTLGGHYSVQSDVRILSGSQLAVMLTVQKEKERRIRRIEFIGNQYTLDHVIRREMLLSEGDVLIESDLNRSVEKISRLEFLKNVRKEMRPVSDEELDVYITVEESPSATASIEMTMNSDFEPELKASYAHSNFLGTGAPVKFEAARGIRNTSFSLNGSLPYVLESGAGIDYNVFYKFRSLHSFPLFRSFTSQTDTIEDYRKNRQIGFEFGLDQPMGVYNRLNLSAGLSHTVSELKPSELRNSKEEASGANNEGVNTSNAENTSEEDSLLPRYWKATLSSTWVYNGLDQFFAPTSGVYSKLKAEYGLPIGDTTINVGRPEKSPFLHYGKIRWDVSFYKGILGDRLILNPRVALGFGRMFNKVECGEDSCVQLSRTMPHDERFTAGGVEPVRGYSIIGPTVPINGKPVASGGNLLTTASMNFNLPPLGGGSVLLSAFVDGGYLYGRDGRDPDVDMNTFRLERVTLSKWLYSAGVQLQVNTPIAPLVFIFSAPLSPKYKYKGGHSWKLFTLRTGITF